MPETVWLIDYSFEGSGKVLVEADTQEEAEDKFNDGDFDNERETGCNYVVDRCEINKTYIPDDYTGKTNFQDVLSLTEIARWVVKKHCVMTEKVELELVEQMTEHIRQYFIDPEIPKDKEELYKYLDSI